MKQFYFFYRNHLSKHRSKVLLIAFLVGVNVFVFGQTTIYVNSVSGNDASGDGSVGNPFKTFHKGYISTVSGDIIDLTGTFTWTDADETGDVANDGYIISKNLTIQGKGPGMTIIQAASSENTADRRVFTATNSGSFNSLTINGVTIKNGVTSANGTISAGLLILTTTTYYNFSLNVNNCAFENNHIVSFTTDNGFSGAGLAFSGYAYGTLNINSTTFKNNSAYIRAYGAGALYINQSVNANLNSCTFDSNSGRSNYSGNYYGTSGAIFAYRNSINKITNCTFTNNNSDGNGGAIILHQNTTYFTNNTIAGNTVTSASGKGGGILVNDQTNTYLKNNLIGNNTVNGVSNDFHSDSGMTTSNGYNIVEISTGYTFGSTGDIVGDQVNLFGTGISNTPSLANNSSTNSTQTLMLSAGSIAVNVGNNTINGIVPIPLQDQRGALRSGSVDIGSYEFNGTLSTSPNETLVNIKLYPTRTTGILNVSDSRKFQYYLYNSLGQELTTGVVQDKIDISKNAKGLYMIKLKDANFERVFKVVLH